MEIVRNLGVMFDSTMTLSSHVNYLRRSINFQLRNLWRVHQFIDQDSCHHAVRALITYYYYNGLFTTLSTKELTRLQQPQNNAARLVFAIGRRTDAINLLDTTLHWLPVRQRVLLYVFKSIQHLSPNYISDYFMMLLLAPCARLLTVTVLPFPDSATLSLVTKDSTWQQLRHGVHFLWT